MANLVITGSGGQLGRELCRQCATADGLSEHELDITDANAVRSRLDELQPDALINTAAHTDVDRAESEPDVCRAVNVDGVENLVRVCQQVDCPLIQISTDYVFAGSKPLGRPWREDDPPAPRGVYAKSKYDAEQIVATLPRHLVIRTCGLYASADHADAQNFVNTMLRLAQSGQTLRVVDDQRCTPSYVPHVATAVLFLVEAALAGQATWGTYHITNQGHTTWHDFTAEILRLSGVDANLQAISAQQYAAPAPRPSYSVLDTSKYHRLHGPAMPPWQAALAQRLGVDAQEQIQ